MALNEFLQQAREGIQGAAEEVADFWEQIERRQRREEAQRRREEDLSSRRAAVRQKRMAPYRENLDELVEAQPAAQQAGAQQAGGPMQSTEQLLETIGETLEEIKDLLTEIRDAKDDGAAKFGP